jgi:hypothetical protein
MQERREVIAREKRELFGLEIRQKKNGYPGKRGGLKL